MGIAAMGVTALLRELALNVSVCDTNHCLLCPARSRVNAGTSFGRVYIHRSKVEDCHAGFESDLVYR